MLRLDQRRQFGEQHAAHGRQIALPLQHVRETGEVGLEPVLLGVAIGREAQIADHGVDVVLELRDLAARLDLYRPGQIALGHRGRHLGDGAHLGGQIRRQQVHVAGQVLPGSRRTRHVRLTTQAALHADLAGHRGHLIREGGERVGHVVDGLGQRRNLALGGHRQILFQVPVGQRRHHLHDAAHLFGEIGGHDVDGVGEVLPGAGDPGHLCLTAQATLGADFARHARDLAGKTVELVDHGVDGVLELEDLALHVHRDLARQIAARHRRGHFGDVAYLRGEIRRQQIHVVGQILPRSRDARYHRLAAQAAIRAHFARHARHFAGERAQLVHHGVQCFLQQQDLAAHVHRDLAR